MRYIFLIPLLFLLSCGKSEFKLEFDLDKEITANYNVTYYAADTRGGITVQAVASVRKGECELTGITHKPSLAYITMRTSPVPLVVFLDKGTVIKISGEEEPPLTWNVEGGKINEQLNAWRLEHKDFLMNNDTDSINMAVRNYVEENPENPISLILMLSYFNRSVDEKGYNELMKNLNGEARETDWLTIAARSDQLYHSYFYPAKLQSMIMRGSEYGVDTLLTDGKNPVFISFWQTGYNDKKILIDSLKTLEKELPDSVKILADICLDVDSLGWKNAIRRDSLEDVKRFWTPLGINDPTIQKFKVVSLPYFIVFNREGKQDYRGTSLEEAMKTYRTILNTSYPDLKKPKKKK